MARFTVRRAALADLPLIEADVAALFAEDSGTREPTIDQTWPALHARAWLESQLGDDRNLLLVAAAPDHAGYLAGALRPADAMRTIPVAVLVSMYVRPALRSAGAGGALLAAFRDWAQAEGAERLSVTAYAANTAALRFYEREGFRPHETRLEAFLPQD